MSNRLILGVIVLFILSLIGFGVGLKTLIASLPTYWQIGFFSAIIIIAFLIDFLGKGKKGKIDIDFMGLCKMVLRSEAQNFERFYRLYFSQKNDFLSKYYELEKHYENFNFNQLKAIELLFIFADSKDKIMITDWKGEENEMEIESFFNLLPVKPAWDHSIEYRNSLKANHRDQVLLIKGLLKAIDKDLQEVGYRVLFLNMDWDAYVYLAVPADIFVQVVIQRSKFLCSLDQLG